MTEVNVNDITWASRDRMDTLLKDAPDDWYILCCIDGKFHHADEYCDKMGCTHGFHMRRLETFSWTMMNVQTNKVLQGTMD